MHESLEVAVMDAMRRGLPGDWPRLSAELLPAFGTAQLAGGFQAFEAVRPSDEFNLAVLPGNVPLAKEEEEHWTRLRDLVLSRGSTLVTFVAVESAGRGASWEGFVSNTLRVEHPQLLTLAATRLPSGTWVVEPAFQRVETLARTIQALWRQQLRFFGPTQGRQRVGVELMADKCWKCTASLRTVTGIVIPDRLVRDWQGTDWRYFDGIVPLASLDRATVESLSEAIAVWRVEDRAVTPVEMRSTRGSGTSYWAATCPHCRAVRGAFYVMEERMGYLHDVETRRQGALLYRPLEMDVTFEMFETFSSATEICDHSCISGWELDDNDPFDENDYEGCLKETPNGAGATLTEFLLRSPDARSPRGE